MNIFYNIGFTKLKTSDVLKKRKPDEEKKTKKAKTITIDDCLIKNQKYGLTLDLNLKKFVCKFGLPFEVLDDEGAQKNL